MKILLCQSRGFGRHKRLQRIARPGGTCPYKKPQPLIVKTEVCFLLHSVCHKCQKLCKIAFYIISIYRSWYPNKYKTPSRPKLEIEVEALSFTFGLAWKAIPRPAKFSIGKSFAPSPTAMV